MFLLYGKSPSGKTEYFIGKYKEQKVKILHASDIDELRRNIISTDSPLNDPLPTLINVWYDLDCSEISNMQHYDVYIEAHYFETSSGMMIRQSGSLKYYYGLRNEHLIRNRK